MKQEGQRHALKALRGGGHKVPREHGAGVRRTGERSGVRLCGRCLS